MELSRRAALTAGTAFTASTAFAGLGRAQSGSASGFPGVREAAETAVRDGACPGVAVAVMRRGTLVTDDAIGTANLETGAPVGPGSVFRIASLTKQFTAAAVVKLAAEGRLDLDDPASTHLDLLQPLAPFTLRELMTHTAGLSDSGAPAALPADGKPRSSVDLAREIAAQARPFDFEPGSAWLYSNANYIVLGAVIEQVAGRPFAEALKALIFDPLGLRSLAVDSAAEVVTGRVGGYTPSGAPSGFDNAAFIEIADTGGAGAMRGMAADLCRWHDALLSDRLFERRWVEAMLTPGRLRDGRLSGDNRFSPADAGYGATQYGLGLLLSAGELGRVVQHYGYVNGFSACLETLVDQGVTWAALCNGDVGPNLPFRGVRRAVAARLAAT